MHDEISSELNPARSKNFDISGEILLLDDRYVNFFLPTILPSQNTQYRRQFPTRFLPEMATKHLFEISWNVCGTRRKSISSGDKVLGFPHSSVLRDKGSKGRISVSCGSTSSRL
jgi:hypothetical protein